MRAHVLSGRLIDPIVISTKRLVAISALAAWLSGCGTPTGPSSFSFEGNWGGGSQLQGTYTLATCSATEDFQTGGLCDAVHIGDERPVGLSLKQTGTTVTGTIFLIDGSHAISGTAQGATLVLNATWAQYPNDPNPAAAALVTTLTGWNTSGSGNTMSGSFNLQSTFREGSGYRGTATVSCRLTRMSRN
jgi:hypothetical protein